MFSMNSWADYFMAVAVMLAVYYSIYAIKFYGRQLRGLISPGGALWQHGQRMRATVSPHQPSHQSSAQAGLADPSVPGEISVGHDKKMFTELMGLGSQLTGLIEEAHQKSYDAAELALLLQMVLKDHPTAQSASFRLAINQFIDNQCAKYGFIHLSERDKAVIWDQV
jgi:hypothetical protein